MKKFALLLMTLMFTIFSFASPKMAVEQVYEGDVGWNQEQIVLATVCDSNTIIDTYMYDVSVSIAYINRVENVATDTKAFYIEKIPNMIYKEPIKITSQIFIKRRTTQNTIYTS